MSVIFDGSNSQGKAIAIIVCWMVVLRLMRIQLCSQSVNSKQLLRILNECRSVKYSIRANSLIAAMRNEASVKQAALNQIGLIFPNMLNVVCFSHTLDNIGNHGVIPTLLQFGNYCIGVFSYSNQAKLAWQDLTGRKPKSYRGLSYSTFSKRTCSCCFICK